MIHFLPVFSHFLLPALEKVLGLAWGQTWAPGNSCQAVLGCPLEGRAWPAELWDRCPEDLPSLPLPLLPLPQSATANAGHVGEPPGC